MNVTEQRGAVVTEALSWIGTPYALRARVKGAGCDCVTLLLAVLINAGVWTRETVDAAFSTSLYRGDWFHNTNSERYLSGLMRFGKLMSETKCYASVKANPGDLVLTKCAHSRLFNHGGIVVEWPHVVHSVHPAVEEVDASRHPMWLRHDIAIFNPFEAA